MSDRPHVRGYEVLEHIGEGSMGAVWAARDEVDGHEVAIKILWHNERDDPMVAERFRREVQAASAIGHPGIPQVYDAGQLPGDRLFLVMERLHGQDLDVWCRTGPRTKLELATAICASLEPLAAAHERGVIHRDLKPENIFMENDGGVRLLDFGVARQLGTDVTRKTATGISVGTPAYMSPEQATAPSKVRPSSDTWSVGVMLYEAISGALPFDGESLHAVIMAACLNEQRPLAELDPNVAPELAALVDRCLAKDPVARPANGRELAHELSALLAKESVRASLDAPIVRMPSLPSTPPKLEGEGIATSHPDLAKTQQSSPTIEPAHHSGTEPTTRTPPRASVPTSSRPSSMPSTRPSRTSVITSAEPSRRPAIIALVATLLAASVGIVIALRSGDDVQGTSVQDTSTTENLDTPPEPQPPVAIGEPAEDEASGEESTEPEEFDEPTDETSAEETLEATSDLAPDDAARAARARAARERAEAEREANERAAEEREAERAAAERAEAERAAAERAEAERAAAERAAAERADAERARLAAEREAARERERIQAERARRAREAAAQMTTMTEPRREPAVLTF